MHHPRLRALAAALLLAGGCACAYAQSQAIVTHVEGSAASSPKGEKEWSEAQLRKPLRAGDRLWTDPASRVELQAGNHVLRVDGQSQVTVEAARAGLTQVSLRRGTVVARVGRLRATENVEVNTPNLAFRATEPGLYRIDVDARHASTRVTVYEGAGRIFGQRGESKDMEPGHRARYVGRELAYGPPEDLGEPDAFDRWVVAREKQQTRDLPATRTPGGPGQMLGAATPSRANAATDNATRARREAARLARQAERAEAQQRREAQLKAQAREREQWVRQQKDLSDRWRREHEEWLRWQEGGPPPQSNGIPARRVG